MLYGVWGMDGGRKLGSKKRRRAGARRYTILSSCAIISDRLLSNIIITVEICRIRSRGRLPHWEQSGGIYFVTFRLADSLPRPALQAILAKRNNILKTAIQRRRALSVVEQNRLAKLFSEKLDRYLDAGRGICLLSDFRAAKAVRDVLLHFDGKKYELLAWCVMPNHIHVVFRAFEEYGIAAIAGGWKSFSAREVNAVLGRTGPVWQREYYDHLVRFSGELSRIVRYVAENPAKAGLKNWPWVGIMSE
jgi:menaquinone-specific isochorismate synthase